jgi:lambda family phage portal protein
MSAQPSMNLREVPRLTPATALAAIREQIRPNLYERFRSYISPQWGVQRMKDKALLAMGGWGGPFMGGGWSGGQGGSYAGGYTGARANRRQTQQWRPRTNSADSDIIFDLPVLRDRSRDLIRNAPLATGAIGTVCQNVIGPGLQLQSAVEAETLKMTEEEASAWMSKTERSFRLWAESTECDITRTQNFYGLQNLAFRSALESGDVICLLLSVKSDRTPYKLRLQLIEADRLSNPQNKANTTNLTGGVEMDDYGAPLAYHIMRKHPGSIDRMNLQEWDRHAAFGEKQKYRNVIHLFDKTRPGQTRGIPYLTPVIETIKQLDRYTEAEVMAAVVAAMLTVFIKTEESEDVAPMLPNLTGQNSGSTSSNSGLTNDEVGLAAGAIIELGPGEDITTVNPNRPNAGYDLFVQSILRQIGIALGLPFEVLIKHFTASYSASRAALLDAWRFFRNRRTWVADSYCQPIYEAWMNEAVSNGLIKAPGYFANSTMRAAYLQSQWLGEQPMQIDPVKEVEAAQKRLEIRVSTLAQETMALNAGLWTDNLKQQTKERAAAVKAGLITSTTQVGPPAQRETITTAEETIPDSQGQPGQKPVPAGQPGGGGASPATPAKPAPQTPGQGAAKPANTPPAAPAPARKAAVASEVTDEAIESRAPGEGQAAEGSKGDPGAGSEEDDDSSKDVEDEEADETKGDGEDERKP